MSLAFPSAILARSGAAKLTSNSCRPTSALLHTQLRAWSTSNSPSGFFKHSLRWTHSASCLPVSRLAPSLVSPKFLKMNRLLRKFSASPSLAAASQTSGPSPIKDETHPSLYYHLFDDSRVPQPFFALSFISRRPSSQHSKTILGWLPAAASADGEENGLNDFRENKTFINVLHDCVKANILDDDIWTNAAIQAHSGWMHVFDQRNPPPLGRIPDSDDIIASVRVEEGRILSETYSPMPTYRLATADGVCTLTDVLQERLAKMLEQEP